jgi:hypothetical protein
MQPIVIIAPYPLRSEKTCSCGRRHTHTTSGARICSAGHIWFECPCGSTMVQQSEAFIRAKAEAEATRDHKAHMTYLSELLKLKHERDKRRA